MAGSPRGEHVPPVGRRLERADNGIPRTDRMPQQQAAAPAGAARLDSGCAGSACDLDQLIVPKRSARLEHPDLQVRNVLLRGVGHMSLPIRGRVVHEIAMLLAHLDEDGSTLHAGVTRLSGPPPSAAEAIRTRAFASTSPTSAR